VLGIRARRIQGTVQFDRQHIAPIALERQGIDHIANHKQKLGKKIKKKSN
jgi:hypothetical protein